MKKIRFSAWLTAYSSVDYLDKTPGVPWPKKRDRVFRLNDGSLSIKTTLDIEFTTDDCSKPSDFGVYVDEGGTCFELHLNTDPISVEYPPGQTIVTFTDATIITTAPVFDNSGGELIDPEIMRTLEVIARRRPKTFEFLKRNGFTDPQAFIISGLLNHGIPTGGPVQAGGPLGGSGKGPQEPVGGA